MNLNKDCRGRSCILILIMLTILLLKFASSQDIHGVPSEETEPQIVKIFIANFEAKSPIPSEFEYLEQGGPAMLRTALIKAASMEEHLKFAFVERRKINTILEEGEGIQQKLSEVFDEIREKLKAQGAEYVVFISYFILSDDRVRVDARMVKVEEVAAEISEFHVFSLNDPDPLQPLANKIVTAFLPKNNEEESYLAFIPTFSYEGPEQWKTIKEIIPLSLMKLLSRLTIENKKLNFFEGLESTKGKHLLQLAAEFPQIDYFIVGDIFIFEQEQETTAIINVRIVDREGKILNSTQTRCELAELIKGKDVLKNLAYGLILIKN